MIDREDFERLVLPLMRWLRATRNPHTSVIVTSTCAEMVSGEMSVVESDERIIECVCAEIDPSDRPCLVCECSAPAQDAPIDRAQECGYCDGSGLVTWADKCGECNGTGKATPIDPAREAPIDTRCDACIRAGRPGPCIECAYTGKAAS